MIVPDANVTAILPADVRPADADICLPNVHVPFIAVVEVEFPIVIGITNEFVWLVEQILIAPDANLPAFTPILIVPVVWSVPMLIVPVDWL